MIIYRIIEKISAGISALKRIKEMTDQDILKSVYYGLIQPHFDYCCEVWYSINITLLNRLQMCQNHNELQKRAWSISFGPWSSWMENP